MNERRSWGSEPIYIARDNIYRIPFRLVVTSKHQDDAYADEGEGDEEIQYATWHEVTILLVDQHHNGQNHSTFQLKVGESCDTGVIDYDRYVKDDKLIFCITDIQKREYVYAY